MAHQVIDSWAQDDLLCLTASIDGYPGWMVRVGVVVSGTMAALAELQIIPRQVATLDGAHPFTGSAWGPGAKGRGYHPRPVPMRDWSRRAEDVPPGGLSARLLRSVNPGELVELAQKQARADSSRWGAEVDRYTEWARDHEPMPQIEDYLKGKKVTVEALGRTTRRRHGREGHGIDYYLKWAVWYVDKVASGCRKPIAELAREHQESVTFVRDTVDDARKRHGLLSAQPGRPGGDLTEKAKALLEERAGLGLAGQGG